MTFSLESVMLIYLSVSKRARRCSRDKRGPIAWTVCRRITLRIFVGSLARRVACAAVD